MTDARRALRTALLLGFAVIAAFVAMYLPQPALPAIAADLGAGAAATGALVSVLTLAIGLGSLLVAPLSDRFGRRGVLVGSSLLLALPTFACALAPTLGSLLALRFAQGVFVAGTLSVGLAYLGEEFDARVANRLAGGFIAATVSGGILSRLLGGSVADAFGWRAAFVASGALALVAGAALARALPPSRGFRAEGRLAGAYRGMLRHLRDGRLLRLYAVGFAIFFSFLGVYNALPFRLDAPPYALGAGAIGLVYLSYAAGLVSSNVSGPLLTRFGARRLLTLALGANALCHLLTAAAPLWGVVAALTALCFAQFLAQSTAAALLATHAGGHRAGANALYLLAYYLGGSLGSALLVAVWGALGWGGVVAVTAGVLLLGAGAAATLPGDGATPRR